MINLNLRQTNHNNEDRRGFKVFFCVGRFDYTLFLVHMTEYFFRCREDLPAMTQVKTTTLHNSHSPVPMDQTNSEDGICILQCAMQQTSFATSVEGWNWNRWGWGWSFACLKEHKGKKNIPISRAEDYGKDTMSLWSDLTLTEYLSVNMWAVCISVFCSKMWRS